jgi:hypothetical protein
VYTRAGSRDGVGGFRVSDAAKGSEEDGHAAASGGVVSFARPSARI